jgi:hypothetical protein
MFQLPTHIDSPLGSGVFCLAVAFLFAGLLWAYDRHNRIGNVLSWFFERRFAIAGQENAQKFGRRLLVGMCFIFSAMAAFGLIVASGLIKNGDPPKPMTIDQFIQQKQK